jgi:hypothetical protein
MNKRLASAIPIATVCVIVIIILQTLISSFDTEGWNPMVATFATTIFPIVIVGAIIIVMLKMFVDDKLDSGESAGGLNPIVHLVRKLRGQKARTPEELSAIMDKKMAEELFTNQPIENDCDIPDAKMAREVFGDIEDGVEEGKIGIVKRPINPIVHLVRHLRKDRR